MGRFLQTLPVMQAKSRWRTRFDEKFAFQFHQHSAQTVLMKFSNIHHMNALFIESVFHFPNAIHQKKLLILFLKKSREKMLVKSTLDVYLWITFDHFF